MGFHEGNDVTAKLVSKAKLVIIGVGITFDRCFVHRLLRPVERTQKRAHTRHALTRLSESRARSYPAGQGEPRRGLGARISEYVCSRPFATFRGVAAIRSLSERSGHQRAACRTDL